MSPNIRKHGAGKIHAANIELVCLPFGIASAVTAAVVVTVMVTAVELLPAGIVVGEILQVLSDGPPLQVRLTALSNGPPIPSKVSR
jgi:hypothetical protein